MGIPGGTRQPVPRHLTMASRRDWQRWARKGTTEQRGYGRRHQLERERRLAAYRPGDPCAHCGQPMPWWPLDVARRYVDLPHNPDRTGYLPGLACRRCNRSEGATRGNQARRQVQAWASARQW